MSRYMKQGNVYWVRTIRIRSRRWGTRRWSPADFGAGKLRPLAGHILGTLSSFFALLPFSAAEVLLYVLVMTILIGIVGLVFRMITEEGRLRRLFAVCGRIR